MKRFAGVPSLLLVSLLPATALARQAAGDTTARQPYFEAREKQSRYEGPGREDPEPVDLKEVRIGYFGPCDPLHPVGGDLWLAANLAVEEANADGGYRGLPFRLIPGWSENPWGNGINQVARMAFVDAVWAVIGGIDGPSTHLAEQVVAKALLTLISPASTDKTVNLANVPWMYSAMPGDQLLAPVLGSALLKEAGDSDFVLLSATDHDSHCFLIELDKYLAGRRTPTLRFEFQNGRDHSALVKEVIAAKPAAVALIASVQDSGMLVNTLRRGGFRGKIFGGPSMGRRSFRIRLVAGVDDIFFPMVAGKCTERDEFAMRFSERFGFLPDCATRYAYESTGLLVAAIRRAGLNRARICDAVRQLSPWNGSAVSIQWDPVGQNTSPIVLGSWSSEARTRVIHSDRTDFGKDPSNASNF